KNQHPIGFYESMKGSFGDLSQSSTYDKYAENIFSNTFLLDSVRWKNFVKRPDGTVLQNDPAFVVASAFIKNFTSKYTPLLQQFNIKNNDAGRLYMKGILEMDTIKAKKMYPDATMTMRVSFGSVRSYQPKDAVKYDYVTTSKGIFEKYIA